MDTALEARADDAVQHAAERLRHADSVHRPCDSVVDLIGDDLASAYAVQHLVTELQVIGGARPWGRRLLGLDERGGGPRIAVGTLMDSMVLGDDATVTGRQLVQPRVAVRLTVRLVRDVEAGATAGTVRAAVGAIGAALEVADLRVSADQATTGDLVADNIGAGLVVLGPEQTAHDRAGPWRGQVVHDGRSVSGVVETTWRAAVDRLVELAELVSAHGRPLRAGELVLLDAFAAATPLSGDGRYVARVDDRDVASVRLGAARPATPEDAR